MDLDKDDNSSNSTSKLISVLLIILLLLTMILSISLMLIVHKQHKDLTHLTNDLVQNDYYLTTKGTTVQGIINGYKKEISKYTKQISDYKSQTKKFNDYNILLKKLVNSNTSDYKVSVRDYKSKLGNLENQVKKYKLDIEGYKLQLKYSKSKISNHKFNDVTFGRNEFKKLYHKTINIYNYVVDNNDVKYKDLLHQYLNNLNSYDNAVYNGATVTKAATLELISTYRGLVSMEIEFGLSVDKQSLGLK